MSEVQALALKASYLAGGVEKPNTLFLNSAEALEVLAESIKRGRL